MGARATTSSTTSTPSSISSTSTSSGGKSYMPDGNWGPGASSASPAAPAMSAAAPVAAFKAPMSVAPSAPAASSATSSGGKSYMPDGNWGPGASSARPVAQDALLQQVEAFQAQRRDAVSLSSFASSKSYMPNGNWGKTDSSSSAEVELNSIGLPVGSLDASSSFSSSAPTRVSPPLVGAAEKDHPPRVSANPLLAKFEAFKSLVVETITGGLSIKKETNVSSCKPNVLKTRLSCWLLRRFLSPLF